MAKNVERLQAREAKNLSAAKSSWAQDATSFI